MNADNWTSAKPTSVVTVPRVYKAGSWRHENGQINPSRQNGYSIFGRPGCVWVYMHYCCTCRRVSMPLRCHSTHTDRQTTQRFWFKSKDTPTHLKTCLMEAIREEDSASQGHLHCHCQMPSPISLVRVET